MAKININQNPYLIQGEIMHQRFSPKKNYFKYKSTYISFPISQIRKLKKALFSLNRFNLFSLDEAHQNHQTHQEFINEILTKFSLSTKISEIILIKHPKILGYVFNPVSFWLCLNKNNQPIAVLSEVNNTCGQKHNYLCFNSDLSPIKSNQWLEAQKEFYVSPFLKIEGKYQFRFEYDKNKANFFINYLVDNKLKLSTYLKCSFKELNNKNLLISFCKIPFATIKTIILIHYQAAKLYFKSIKFYPYPKSHKTATTLGTNKNAK